DVYKRQPLNLSRMPAGANAGVPRAVITIFCVLVDLVFVVRAITLFYSARAGIAVAAAVAVLCVLYFSKRVRRSMSHIENKFLDNLNERELRRSGKKNAVVYDLHQAYMTVGDACPFAGQKLMDSNLRRRFGVNVVGIQRGHRYIPVPGGTTRLYPGDQISVIGTDEQIGRMLPEVESTLPEPEQPLDPSQIKLSSILLSPTSPLVSHTPQSASLRDRFGALVVAVDRGDEHIDSRPDLVFEPGDILWVVGNPSEVNKLK
ncbi:MAG: TrkA C-terminal domain-containing protein, partial [Muribaculaceae bacterium]|nr:TrkA C-terminal domain-containing protein [Muribaculaceae bacterium]